MDLSFGGRIAVSGLPKPDAGYFGQSTLLCAFCNLDSTVHGETRGRKWSIGARPRRQSQVAAFFLKNVDDLS
jgi:hypothetical protein